MTAPIHELLIDGERVLYVGPTTLIASQSEPGGWHVIESDTCTCDGFKWRGSCRHIRVAQLAAEYDRANAVPVVAVAPTPPPCPACGKRPALAPFGQCGACSLHDAFARLHRED